MNVEIHTVRLCPMDIDRGTENGIVRMVAMVQGAGTEYRCYYDIGHMTFLIVMWPLLGTPKERGDYLTSEVDVAAIPVAAGPGGYARSWFLALRSINDQATDEILHTEFVGVVAPQN